MFLHRSPHALDAGAHLLDEAAQVAKSLNDHGVAQLGLAFQSLHLLHGHTGEKITGAVELDAIIEHEDTGAAAGNAIVAMFDARNLPQLASYCNENATIALCFSRFSPAAPISRHAQRARPAPRPNGRMLVRARGRAGEAAPDI